MLLTQQIYGLTVNAESIKPDSTLMGKYKQLLESFNSDPDEEKEYIVILYALDKAAFLSEAIYQSWELGAFNNVKIVVICSNENSLLDVNCSKFFSIKDDTTRMYSKPILYFDEKTNEVAFKQKDSPTLRIRIVESNNKEDSSAE